MERSTEHLHGLPAAALRHDKRSGRTNRKRCKSGVYCDDISLETLLRFVHLPSQQAARQLGLGITVFKRLCRKRGLSKWPYIKPSARGDIDEDMMLNPESQSASDQCTEETSDSSGVVPRHHQKAARTASQLAAARRARQGEVDSLDRLQLLAAAMEGTSPGRGPGRKFPNQPSLDSANTQGPSGQPFWVAADMPAQQLPAAQAAAPLTGGSIEHLAKELASNPGLAEQLAAALQSVAPVTTPTAPTLRPRAPALPASPIPPPCHSQPSPFAAFAATPWAAGQQPACPAYHAMPLLGSALRASSDEPCAWELPHGMSLPAMDAQGSAFASYHDAAGAGQPASSPPGRYASAFLPYCSADTGAAAVQPPAAQGGAAWSGPSPHFQAGPPLSPPALPSAASPAAAPAARCPPSHKRQDALMMAVLLEHQRHAKRMQQLKAMLAYERHLGSKGQ